MLTIEAISGLDSGNEGSRTSAITLAITLAALGLSNYDGVSSPVKWHQPKFNTLSTAGSELLRQRHISQLRHRVSRRPTRAIPRGRGVEAPPRHTGDGVYNRLSIM